MNKSLDIKIDRIRNDSSCQDFIIADAKDGDMGFGVVCAVLDDATCNDAHHRNTIEAIA